MPWWGWVIIGIAAIAALIPLKMKVAKKIFGKKSAKDEESKEDF
jgi:uncharacterized membrane protein YuzA (DUF378 family)